MRRRGWRPGRSIVGQLLEQFVEQLVEQRQLWWRIDPASIERLIEQRVELQFRVEQQLVE